MATKLSFERPVKVRLTDKGKRHFEDFFGSLSDGQQQPRDAFPSLPEPDADGWYPFELWMLLSVFGGMSLRFPEQTAEFFEGNVMATS